MNLLKNSVATACVLLFAPLLLWPGATTAQEQQAEITIAITDTAGKPVPNVSAYWFANGKSKKMSVSTDGGLTVAAATGLVVIQCDGYQYGGLALRNKTPAELQNASIILRTHSEPGRELKTLPAPVAPEQRRQIVQEVVDMHWAKLKSAPKDRSNQAVCFELLAELDSQGLNDFVESTGLGVGPKGMAKRLIIKTIATSDTEQAIEVADSVKNPMHRATLLDALLHRLPANSPYIEAVEEQFIDTIQAVSQPAFRYAMWSSLGEHYIHSGKRELADKIVDEHLAEVKKLPNGGWAAYPKSLFAALLVEQDPDLALKLIEGCQDSERARALGRLAFHCCLTNPKLAMELLDKIEHAERLINNAENRIKVAHRMAGTQTDAAFEVAASIDETNQQAWAWGLIASKLLATEPAQAKTALANAIETLTAKDAEAKAATWFSVPLTLAGLLPVAEKVAPEKMETMVWQSVWLAVPRSRWNMGGGSKTERRQDVAAALSRYDRDIAGALLGDAKLVIGTDPSRAAVSQVALDVDGIPNFVDRLNHGKQFSAVFRPRAKIARMLSGTDEAFWNEVSLPGMMTSPTQRFEDD